MIRLDSTSIPGSPGDYEARIVTCRPTRGFFAPSEEAEIEIRTQGVSPTSANIIATVRDLDTTVGLIERPLEFDRILLRIPLPPETGRGYGIDIELVLSSTGKVIDRRSTAVDVQDSWIDAPRYGFLSEFAPEERYEQRADQLLERHINVVQFYDWMYRHYQFIPPNDTFTDAIGRTLSLASTQRAINVLRDRGIASMAYGAVYGAEPEYALQHLDGLLYDGNAVPISLGGAFYYQDVRPGRWRTRILNEFREAITRLGFNGIHADQYGFRDDIVDADGAPVDMAVALAGIVGASDEVIRQVGGDGVIFNCVNNWPIEAISSTSEVCSYIELWPPHVHLRDLSALVENARKLAPSRQVILAAYMSCAAPFPDAAEEATLLTAAAIHASGGFHLLLGEGDAILTDPYFPKFVRPGASFQQKITAHWKFIVQCSAYLFDRSLRLDSSVAIDGMWQIHRVGSLISTVSIVNADPDDLWDVVKPVPGARRDVVVEVPLNGEVEAVVVASPDEEGPPRRIPFSRREGTLRLVIPSVRTWTLAVIKSKQPGS